MGGGGGGTKEQKGRRESRGRESDNLRVPWPRITQSFDCRNRHEISTENSSPTSDEGDTKEFHARVNARLRHFRIGNFPERIKAGQRDTTAKRKSYPGLGKCKLQTTAGVAATKRSLGGVGVAAAQINL